MRHGDKINNLGRKKAHREALLANLASQLITHKRIVTTLAKAKALRTYVEPLITKTKNTASKEAIMHNHRIVFSYLNDKAAVKELFTVVLIALSISASAKMIFGFFPPNSKLTFLNMGPATLAMCLPVTVPPVNSELKMYRMVPSFFWRSSCSINEQDDPVGNTNS